MHNSEAISTSLEIQQDCLRQENMPSIASDPRRRGGSKQDGKKHNGWSVVLFFATYALSVATAVYITHVFLPHDMGVYNSVAVLEKSNVPKAIQTEADSIFSERTAQLNQDINALKVDAQTLGKYKVALSKKQTKQAVNRILESKKGLIQRHNELLKEREATVARLTHKAQELIKQISQDVGLAHRYVVLVDTSGTKVTYVEGRHDVTLEMVDRLNARWGTTRGSHPRHKEN